MDVCYLLICFALIFLSLNISLPLYHATHSLRAAVPLATVLALCSKTYYPGNRCCFGVRFSQAALPTNLLPQQKHIAACHPTAFDKRDITQPSPASLFATSVDECHDTTRRISTLLVSAAQWSVRVQKRMRPSSTWPHSICVHFTVRWNDFSPLLLEPVLVRGYCFSEFWCTTDSRMHSGSVFPVLVGGGRNSFSRY